MTTTWTDRLAIEAWDEQPYVEPGNGTKFTKASVRLGAAGDITAASFESIMYYRSDGTSTFVSVMQLTATLEGRAGSLALAGEGRFEEGTARMELRIIEGTGELQGVTGRLESVSTHADYPNMPLTLHYDLG